MYPVAVLLTVSPDSLAEENARKVVYRLRVVIQDSKCNLLIVYCLAFGYCAMGLTLY